MSKSRIVWTTLLLAGLMASVAYGGQQWSKRKKIQPGSYLPPTMNGWNIEHECDHASGICVPGGIACQQAWDDTNNSGVPDAGDTVSCKNRGNVGW